jgi:nucleoid DNA-binding protein
MKKQTVKIGYRHPLCKALQNKGYSVRLSQDIVRVVFEEIKAELLDKKEVDLPIGRFTVVPETRKKQRRVGLHGPEWCYTKKYQVKFKYGQKD